MSQINCYHQHFLSLVNSNAALNYLVQKTFQGVAQNNVIKMIPNSTNKQNLYTLKSFVAFGHTQVKSEARIMDQKDPISPPLDNLSVHQISIDAQGLHSLLKNKIQTKSMKTQKSARPRKFTNSLSQKQNQVSKSKFINNLEELTIEIKQQTFDPAQQKLRFNYLNVQKQQRQQKQIYAKNHAEREQKKKINEKIIKDIKQFTYDYEGKMHGQGNGETQMQKLLFLKQKFVDLKTIKPNYQTIKHQIVQIQKGKKIQKPKERLSSQPFFSEQPKSIISYLNQNSISQGVRITETGKNNQKLTKQNSNKPTGLKAYKIGQYKSLSQNLKFKQHPRTGSLYQAGSRSILDGTINSHQHNKKASLDNRLNFKQGPNRKIHSKSHFSYNAQEKNQTLDMERSRNSIDSNSQVEFKAKVKYSGLPFIKTKGYRAIDIASQRSFKIQGEESRISGKKSKRSKIQIDNCELFSDNFAFQVQN